jgi:uncharacterized membrane protein YbhN (UPF0104 family)
LGLGLGIALAFPVYVALVGGATLLSVLPISLGGWGVREVGMVTLFGAVGVAPERALALSLIWGFLPLLICVPAGLLWWIGGAHAHKVEVLDRATAAGNLPAASNGKHGE